jgi:hypothetical protein
MQPIKDKVGEAITVLNDAAEQHPGFASFSKELADLREPLRREILKTLFNALQSIAVGAAPAVENFYKNLKADSEKLFDSHLYNEGPKSALKVPSIPVYYKDETPTVNGFEVLNQYFDLIVKEIIAQGGLIDKFIGDCVMAVFKGEFHLDRAIEASLAIRNHIEALPQAASKIEFHPKVSIGINSGEMISGNIGSKTLKRLDYTVIGDTVNTAQRLQSLAQNGQILINEEAYKKVKQSFNCQLLGSKALKNKSIEVIVYEVLN